jgi:hypothetical protein
MGHANEPALWSVDITVLGKAYRDAGGRAYDAGAADATLAEALASLTGNDRDRVERLLHRSGLVREEWYLNNDEYLKRVIEGAVTR